MSDFSDAVRLSIQKHRGMDDPPTDEEVRAVLGLVDRYLNEGVMDYTTELLVSALRDAGVRLPFLGEKRYPDTADGARQCLMDESTLDHERIRKATAKPDPSVNGVWLLCGAGDEIEGMDVVVYLRGYTDAYGVIRDHNDFECGTSRDCG